MTIPLNCLMVEDTPDDAELVLRELHRGGFEVTSERVENEADLRAALRSDTTWDIVISDYRLPRFCGSDALEIVKQEKQDLPFIIVSGTIGEETAVNLIRSGAVDYLLKDRLTRLGSAVSHALEENRQNLAAREAEASRDSLAAILEATSDLVSICSLNGKLRYLNQAGRRRLGLEPSDDITQVDFAHFLPRADDHPILTEGFPTAIREGSWSGEATLRSRSGEEFPVSQVILAHASDGGKPQYLSATMRDITERRRNEQVVRESEERFRLVARAMSDVIWDWDLTTDTLWWNNGFLTTFGFTCGEIEPSVESRNQRIHPADLARVRQGMQLAIEKGDDSWSAEYRISRKDGGYAIVADRGYILRNAEGHAFRMVGGMRDLTEEKKLEAQTLRSQRMENVGNLAGGIAHDLNNVLAPIKMAIELLKRDTPNGTSRAKVLDIINSSCDRGANLVRQVLSFARGVEGDRISIQLSQLVLELESMVMETFPRNIHIETEIANDLWAITGNPTQIQQVLLNLTVNARDAMPDGGDLTITVSNFIVDAQFASTSSKAKEGSYVRLKVTDNGCGIPVEIRERIFEQFFTTKAQGKGTGLGLATVFTVVKNHGGFQTIESEVGQGTTFNIYLPADLSLSNSEVISNGPTVLLEGRNELVLVVDDEHSICEITQATLERFGYRVITARNGAEAVAIYAKQSHEIDIVLTDMMMPEMDGNATIEVMKILNPSVRIIAVSGIESTGKMARSRHAVVRDFILKPFTAEYLLSSLRKVLDAEERPVPAK